MNINKFNVNVVSMCLTLKKINKDIFIRKNINRVTNFAIKVCSHISILIKKKKKKRKNRANSPCRSLALVTLQASVLVQMAEEVFQLGELLVPRGCNLPQHLEKGRYHCEVYSSSWLTG